MSLTSSVYTVEDGIITSVPYGTSASDFKTHLAPATGASLDVYQSNGTTLETGNVITGDEVIVTAQDGTTTGTYIITVNQNTDASVTSTAFTVSALSNGTQHGRTGTITDVPSGTSVYDFKNHITPATGATFDVYQSDETTTESGNVISGDEVIVTAEDGTSTATYTITVLKNSDASVTSSTYTVSELSGGTSGTGTITDVPFGTSVNDFSVTPATGAIWSVYLNDGTTLETGDIVTGDKVIVTAQDRIQLELIQ